MICLNKDIKKQNNPEEYISAITRSTKIIITTDK